MDTQEKKAVPSVLLTPQWVTTKNMNATIIKDKFVPANQLCAGPTQRSARRRESRRHRNRASEEVTMVVPARIRRAGAT